jgi:quercetin dioxygenase-like cupin family protein
MGYSKIHLDEAEDRARTPAEPVVRAIGYELRDAGDSRPREMRFNYFYYEEGDTARRHRQEKQEELLFVVDGRIEVEVDDDVFTASTGDFVVIDPDSWRQVRALADTELLAVGAPNVADDHVIDESTDPA